VTGETGDEEALVEEEAATGTEVVRVVVEALVEETELEAL